MVKMHVAVTIFKNQTEPEAIGQSEFLVTGPIETVEHGLRQNGMDGMFEMTAKEAIRVAKEEIGKAKLGE